MALQGSHRGEQGGKGAPRAVAGWAAGWREPLDQPIRQGRNGREVVLARQFGHASREKSSLQQVALEQRLAQRAGFIDQRLSEGGGIERPRLHPRTVRPFESSVRPTVDARDPEGDA